MSIIDVEYIMLKISFFTAQTITLAIWRTTGAAMEGSV